ncbi:C-3 sterol dehydrogenase/C-4 decarboxylase [Clohesyomyces aquaticus]|uniref:C-3 sterol dehydrogenase/C-4 decarboxylase n=1 Tax=Clohesyomyces aquaticus TaxID=1231657 RepID=A0A1Y1YSI0_9PLEO|nr:C-3 sterol dehydrogenase/C-4 decarboxylase [Clohesyomyces aquaticus]
METRTPLGTVLITGGAGFLGTHIVHHLLSHNLASHIAILSRSPRTPSNLTSFFPTSTISPSDPRISYHPADLSSVSSLSSAFSAISPDLVFHIAAAKSSAPAREQQRTTILGTQNLLAAAKSCAKTKALVYTGSNTAIHPSGTTCIASEDVAVLWTKYDRICGAYTAYGRAKAIADADVRAANSTDLKTVVLRVPIIHGQGSPMIESVAKSIRQSQQNMQIGGNEKMFEFVYAGNAAIACVEAAKFLISEEHPNKAEVEGTAFHITDGTSMKFWDFWRRCCDVAGKPVEEAKIKVLPFWFLRGFASFGEWVVWLGTLGRSRSGFGVSRAEVDYLDEGIWWDISRAKNMLGYQPEVTIEDGIKRGMEWGMRAVK